jgi:hypothetical protein
MAYRGALKAGYIRERKYSSVEKSRSELIKLQKLIIDFSRRKRERALKNRRGNLWVDLYPSVDDPEEKEGDDQDHDIERNLITDKGHEDNACAAAGGVPSIDTTHV